MAEPENIDDELLSAYLDGELAPEERARVEERLAADPAARQLLEQLRFVSHAVKGLPSAPLGADIRDTVLRRAERAMLISNPKGAGELASVGAKSFADRSPRFTIGRSRRGWIWAGVATAAGLAVMAFESNSNRDANVAERSVDSLDRPQPNPESGVVAKSLRRETPSGEAASPPPAMTAAPTAGDLATQGSRVQREQERVADGSGNGNASVAAPQVAHESRVGGENKENRLAGGRGGGLTAAGTLSDAESAMTNSDGAEANFMVVHVRVEPGAFEQRAFDRVLLLNGISVEEPADESKAATAVPSRLAKDEKPSVAEALRADSSSPTSAPAAPGTENTDLVLVEAPAAQIHSCLEALHKDDHDYFSVAIDNDQGVAKKAATEKASSANVHDENWGQYNRGTAPPRQELQRSSDNRLYYQTKQGAVAIDRGYDGNRGAQQLEQPIARDKNAANFPDQRGRAMRMRSQSSADVAHQEVTLQDTAQQFSGGNARAQRLDAKAAPQSNANSTFGFAGRGATEVPKEKAAPPSDDALQVLFVLTSGDQPATPPADTKATK